MQRPHFVTGKPLSTRSAFSLMSIVFVDTDVRRAGPRLGGAERPPDPARAVKDGAEWRVRDPVAFNPDQSLVAACQWGSANQPADDRPWLKSWYYPYDEFDQWPREPGGRCCWWCTHDFAWSPFPLPVSYDQKNDRYRVKGVFCGPSCAKAYASTTGGVPGSVHRIYTWVDEIALRYFGYATRTGGVHIAPPAPARELLQRFCGPKGFTIEQFRTACLHGRSIRICRPNFVTEKQIVEGEQQTAKIVTAQPGGRGARSAHHVDDPDNIPTTRDLVKQTRMPFAGRGARRLDDFMRKGAKRKR